MNEMVPMYGFGGGGGTGGTLTVTAPAGVTVTVSKDGKTKTKVADSSGVAVFKGLSTGEWTMTIKDGTQTSAPQTVTVTADYSITMSFFAATINVTYPAGATCTATDGVTTLTAPDTSGTWVCVVSNVGDWTVTATNGEKTDSHDVKITTDGQTEAVDLAFWQELYINGESFTDVTGGWKAYPANDSNYVIFNPENIQFVNNSKTAYTAAVYTVNKVDVTNFRTLVVKVSGEICQFGITNTPLTTNITGECTYVSRASTSGTGSLDLSGVTGSYYIMISARMKNFTVTEVYMER